MRRILLAYGAIHVNVLLVSFFLVGVLNEVVLIALQVAFLLLYCGSGNVLRYLKEIYP